MTTDTFEQQNQADIEGLSRDDSLKSLSRQWIEGSARHNYSYHFTWLGLPIIQYPQDIVAIQEIVWSVKPDLIIETGIARGGSVIFHASLLELLGGDGLICGIDVDIRESNRNALEQHPLFHRVRLLEGSSTDSSIVEEVHQLASTRDRILVILDSNHTHEHVSRELDLYADLVSPDSYLIVLDTIIEDLPSGYFADRPWDRGNNPKTAVREFLSRRSDFSVDQNYENKLLISTAPSGYLKRAGSLRSGDGV